MSSRMGFGLEKVTTSVTYTVGGEVCCWDSKHHSALPTYLE